MERTDPSERRDNGLSGKAHVRFGSLPWSEAGHLLSPHCDRKSSGEFGSVSVKNITTPNFNVQYYPQKRKLHDPGNGAG